jgi:hypothetical protein
VDVPTDDTVTDDPVKPPVHMNDGLKRRPVSSKIKG